MTDDIIEPTSLQFYPSKPRYESIIRYSNSRNESFVLRVSTDDLKLLEEYTNNLTVEWQFLSDEDKKDAFWIYTGNERGLETYSQLETEYQVNENFVKIAIEEIQSTRLGNWILALKVYKKLQPGQTESIKLNQKPLTEINRTIAVKGTFNIKLNIKSNTQSDSKFYGTISRQYKITETVTTPSIFTLYITAISQAAEYGIYPRYNEVA